nr:MAG TPA: hypothetical protein [Caudoviricetes sp.]
MKRTTTLASSAGRGQTAEMAAQMVTMKVIHCPQLSGSQPMMVATMSAPGTVVSASAARARQGKRQQRQSSKGRRYFFMISSLVGAMGTLHPAIRELALAGIAGRKLDVVRALHAVERMHKGLFIGAPGQQGRQRIKRAGADDAVHRKIGEQGVPGPCAVESIADKLHLLAGAALAQVNRLLEDLVGEVLRQGCEPEAIPPLAAIPAGHQIGEAGYRGQMARERAGPGGERAVVFLAVDELPAGPVRPVAAGDACIGLSAAVPLDVAPAAFKAGQRRVGSCEISHYSVTPVST